MLRMQPRSLEVILVGTSARVCDVIKTHKIRMYALRSAILRLVGVVFLEQPQSLMPSNQQNRGTSYECTQSEPQHAGPFQCISHMWRQHCQSK